MEPDQLPRMLEALATPSELDGASVTARSGSDDFRLLLMRSGTLARCVAREGCLGGDRSMRRHLLMTD